MSSGSGRKVVARSISQSTISPFPCITTGRFSQTSGLTRLWSPDSVGVLPQSLVESCRPFTVCPSITTVSRGFLFFFFILGIEHSKCHLQVLCDNTIITVTVVLNFEVPSVKTRDSSLVYLETVLP